MKRGFIILCTLSLVSVLGLGVAGLGLDARKDDAALFSTQLSGDAAAAEDFTVTVSTVDTGTYKLYLYHDLGLDMAARRNVSSHSRRACADTAARSTGSTSAASSTATG